eukprot:NODE_487_length_6903_cov_0.412111.p8 type:complete len:102 gc:universal NODE_487_length_6903_cov_0.412111:2864-3169(+)
MPIRWHVSKVSFKICSSKLVQVTCKQVSIPNTLYIYSAISKDSSQVDPEAPHVMSLNVGPNNCIFESRLNRLYFPGSVLGGKYSNDQLSDFCSNFFVIFIN